MEESTTYQAILRKGRLAEARRFLFVIAEAKFGPPGEGARATINAVEDADQLELLGKRVLHVDNWDELLASSSRRRRNGRKDRRT